MAVLAALHDENVEYVLVGGVAIGLHGFERATSGIDLFVRPSGENIERLRRALRRVFDDPSIDEITAEDLAGEYPTVRYGPPEADYLIDILGRLGSAIAFDDLEYQPLEIAGTSVRRPPSNSVPHEAGHRPADRSHRRRSAQAGVSPPGRLMPVQKFRTSEDARRAQRSVPGSETNVRRMTFVLEFWSRARPKQVPHGVFKYRSQQEAQDAALSRR